MAIELLERMTNKVGPLPAWAWAAIPAGAYVAWSYYKAAQGTAVISDVEDTGGAEGTAAEDYGINTGGVSIPGYGTSPDGSSNLPPTQPREDNQTWFRQASRYLLEQGFKSTDVVTALNAYIYGFPQTISATQMQALQRAILEFGPAPDPAFVPGTTPPPTTPPPTTKPPVIKVPDAPTNVQVGMAGQTTAKVSWGVPQQNGGATIIGYKVERLQRVNGVWKIMAVKLGVASTRTMNFPVSRGQYHTFKVYARNSKGYGPGAYQSIRVP